MIGCFSSVQSNDFPIILNHDQWCWWCAIHQLALSQFSLWIHNMHKTISYIQLQNIAASVLLSQPNNSFTIYRMYTEVHTEDVAISLFIKRLSDEDAGQYKCSAVYAGNMDIQASVSVSIFREYFHFKTFYFKNYISISSLLNIKC